jgi:hypothetical protein
MEDKMNGTSIDTRSRGDTDKGGAGAFLLVIPGMAVFGTAVGLVAGQAIAGAAAGLGLGAVLWGLGLPCGSRSACTEAPRDSKQLKSGEQARALANGSGPTKRAKPTEGWMQ